MQLFLWSRAMGPVRRVVGVESGRTSRPERTKRSIPNMDRVSLHRSCCVYGRIVNTPCFWGPMPEATWKRPLLLISAIPCHGIPWAIGWDQRMQSEQYEPEFEKSFQDLVAELDPPAAT